VSFNFYGSEKIVVLLTEREKEREGVGVGRRGGGGIERKGTDTKLTLLSSL